MSRNENTVVLVVQRVFGVKAEMLFDAWTRPELMTKWFHAKDNWTTPSAESDLREGGGWSIEMKTDEGRILRAFGVYRLIERPSRLVFTWHPLGDPEYETLVTLRFRELAGGSTEMTLTHEGLRSEADRSDHEGGWAGCLGALQAWISEEIRA